MEKFIMIDRSNRMKSLQLAQQCETLYLEVTPMQRHENGDLMSTVEASDNADYWMAELRSLDGDTFYEFDEIKPGVWGRVVDRVCHIFHCEPEFVYWS